MNWLVHGLAALIPMIMGMIWYNPRVFGTVWMKETGLTEEEIRSGNMGLIYGSSLLLAFVLTTLYPFAVNHSVQFMAFFRSTAHHGMGVDVDSEVGKGIISAITDYHDRFQTLKHGMYHGMFASIVVLLPVMGMNALFERRSFKYFLINWGYWTVTLVLMMGVIGEFNNVEIQTMIDDSLPK